MSTLVKSYVMVMAVCVLGQLAAASVRAAGPIERMVELQIHPDDPKVLFVRYGGASEGFLFSRDGGRSFRAMCTGAMDPKLKKISRQGSLYRPLTALDKQGRVIVVGDNVLWSDDASGGCAWRKSMPVEGRWITTAPLADPKSPDQLFALATTSRGQGDEIEAWTELLVRDASGTWTTGPALRAQAARQRAYGENLLLAATEAGTRMYATINIAQGDLSAPTMTLVVYSEDAGKTWKQSGILPTEQEFIAFVATDPMNPDVILGVESLTDEPDTLYVSKDRGKTFAKHAVIQDFTGVTFAPDGRVFIGDAGDGLRPENTGGVWSAPRLGEPLKNIVAAKENESPNVDCVRYDPSSQKLFVCKIAYFGLLDTMSGEFEKLSEFETVETLIDCPGRDMFEVCEPQLNEGAAWCCTGHYPFTPFCGEYDVTMQDGRRVFCGLSGRQADILAGRRPGVTADAGVGDGGVRDGGAVAPRMDAGASSSRDGSATQVDARAVQKPEDTDDVEPSGSARSSDGGRCSLSPDRARPSAFEIALLAASAAWISGRRRRRRRDDRHVVGSVKVQGHQI